MKTIKTSLLVSLVPLLAPMTALAQSGTQTDTQTGQTGTQTETRQGSQTGQSSSAQERTGDSASWRASKVMGKDVKNAGSETIGEVEDLVVDMENGEIVAVIISTGGFLGIGESLSAVPVAVLRYDEQAEGFKTKLTKEQLSRAPQFKANEWPDYSNATSGEALRSFRATLSDDVTSRDVTTRNQAGAAQGRDGAALGRDGTAHSRGNTRGVNPTDQGNSEKDVEISKDIRADLMKTELSSSAKNVNVITRNESVTLNGEVESDAEHQEVLKIARKHCKDDNVTDNLTVKSN